MIIMPVSRVAGHDGALDGRGAAPARQQRGMAIVAAEPRALEDRLGQNQAVGDDHGDIGAESPKRLLLASLFSDSGVSTVDAELFGGALDRRRRQLQPAPSGRPRRLGVDGHDLVARRRARGASARKIPAFP